MDAVTDTEPSTELRTLTHVLYALYLLGYLTFGLTSIFGVAVAMTKRRDTAGTRFESHFIWLIRTFGIALIVALIGVVVTFTLGSIPALGFILVFLGWLALGLWWMFRVAKGWLCHHASRALLEPEAFF